MSAFLPSADQEQLIAATARVVAARFPAARLVSRTAERVPNRDLDLWPLICEQGWPALMLGPDDGGPGCSPMDLVLVQRELARGLLTPVLPATMLAARLAAHCGEHALAAGLAAGRARAAFAIAASPAGQDDGCYLLQAEGCSHGLLWDEAGARLLAIDCFQAREHCSPIEDSLVLERATLSRAQTGLRLADPGFALDATLLIAAQLAGGARASLELAVDYAKLREQFGQPIGAFQAIKHKAADMLARVEVAWGQIVMAALEPVASPARGFHVAAAKLLAADAALKNAAACIQIHGGMGFTAEVTAHLYLKRAHTLDLLGGANRLQQQRILAAEAPV